MKEYAVRMNQQSLEAHRALVIVFCADTHELCVPQASFITSDARSLEVCR